MRHPDLDPDGQPPPRFNAMRREDRNICEMLGLVKGVLADGTVSAAEIDLLHGWARAHPDVIEGWPGRVLYRRLETIAADGVVTDTEREDLAELLRQIVGGQAGILVGASTATELPLDRPPPVIAFQDCGFVFTGKFAFGPRAACEEAVQRLGGWCAPSVTRQTRYLVIGTFGSRDWIQSSHGRKIEKAVGYRDMRGAPFIIGEDHWADAVP